MKEAKLKNAMRFYLLATQLKYKIRSGWDEKHWNVSKERVESVAEHVYGTCILAISLDSEFECHIDLNKVIKMLVIHELGEVIIGDITPFDNVSKEEKLRIEHEAVIKVIGDLVKKDELISLLSEFDERKTREAIFAYHCDKLEADLQSKVYQDMGYHHSLDDQENNVVFKNAKAQQMVADGAKTAFDIWYEWDKSIYADDEVFAQMLDYAKEHHTQECKRDFKDNQTVYLLDCWGTYNGTQAIAAQAKILQVNEKYQIFLAVLYGDTYQRYSFEDYGRLIFDTAKEANEAADKFPKPKSIVYQKIGKRVYKKTVCSIGSRYVGNVLDLFIRLNRGKDVSTKEIGISIFLNESDARQ